MARNLQRHPLIAGTRITSLGTVVSRVLGLFRDMVTASLLGMSGTPVADAYVMAFRIPNLFRRLFGEGALTAGYLPVLTTQLDSDARVARQLATVVVTWLAVFLALLVALGELLFGLVWLFAGESFRLKLLMGLAAVILPYLMLICVAAQLTTMLYAARHFTIPALTPAVLNIVLLAAAWGVAPWFPGNQVAQAYVLAVGWVVAGILQIAVQVPTLRRLGFHFDYNWPAARQGVIRIARNLAPTVVGLAVTQINTFNDSLIAWGLTAATRAPQPIGWLGGAVCYPMRQGATMAIYLGERMYEVPVGIVGTAIAVAIFPLLSLHAAHGRRRELGADMTFGLRLITCLGVPAAIGLILLAQPIARLLFQRGEFTPEDTVRTARVIIWYATGVWAFCAAPVVVRGFYAVNDYATPVRLAAWMVGLNLALNLSLIWPMAEAGLALATSIAACAQLCVLLAIFSRRHAPLEWRRLLLTTGRTFLATALMAAAVVASLAWIPAGDGRMSQLIRVGVPLTIGAVVYCGLYWLLGGCELSMLIGRHSEKEPENVER